MSFELMVPSRLGLASLKLGNNSGLGIARLGSIVSVCTTFVSCRMLQWYYLEMS